MMTSRKALISNLNYVHLQHVSLGVHLSMRPEVMEGSVGRQDLKDVPTHRHHYKDTSDMVLVDANSNDPSVPCHCCDQHSSHAETIKYNSNENLENIMCDDYLSADELPLSPLSPSSPSTDSSSSSDFTLDDSPVSIYYKEYAHGDLDTPDQQPDIIPLDVETSSPLALDDFVDPSNQAANISPVPDQRNAINNNMDPEDVPFIDWGSDTVLDSNYNALPGTPSSGPPSLCSADPIHQPYAVEKEDVANANQTEVPRWPIDDDLPQWPMNGNSLRRHMAGDPPRNPMDGDPHRWPMDGDLPQFPMEGDPPSWPMDGDLPRSPMDGNPLRTPMDGDLPCWPMDGDLQRWPMDGDPSRCPMDGDPPRCPMDGDPLQGLAALEDSSTQTPKKTITSFHELAQKRRKSGVPPLPKKDKSDWLIVFSPDVEQPPVNELTASAFYHGLVMPQAQPLPEGKEVTTFRELRYRNSISKQIGQQAKANGLVSMGLTDAADVTSITGVQSSYIASTEKQDLQGEEWRSQEGNNGPLRAIQKSHPKLQQPDTPEVPHRLWARNDHRPGTLVDSLSAMTVRMGKHNPPISMVYSREEERPTKGKEAGEQRRGMADGGNLRGLEVFGAPSPSRLLLRLSTNLTPPLALLPHGSTLEDPPRCFAPPLQSWYPRLPARLSPVGANSPPQRALLPLLDTPDMAILLSPLFPRIRRRETGGSDEAQLGDSRLSPKLGYLILHHLCPSLFSLLGDGLKPFQKDVIIGRRRLSPWNLVEASTKSGHDSLHILFYNVSRFQQLRDPQRRFNAFIFGLLNSKQLDLWISRLHHMYDQLSVFYLPSGFLPLSATSSPELLEELLLILQPLSALTFHTDLLFEHHHLPLHDPPTPHSPPTLADHWGVPPFQHILDLGGWIAHNLSREKPKESRSQDFPRRDPQQSGTEFSGDSAQDLLYDNRHVSSPGGGITNSTETQQETTDSRTTWWGQLSQASRLYIPANKNSFSFFRKIKEAPGKEQIQPEQQSSCKARESTERGLQEGSHCEGDSQKTENGKELLRPPSQSARDPAGANGGEGPALRQGDSTPVSVNGAPTTPSQATEEKGGWLGQLFGANSAHCRDLEAKTVKSRRPSSWLPPNVNVVNVVRLLSSREEGGHVFPVEREEHHQSDGRPVRSLRALCDHSASGEAQLSFRKGDVLQLLGTVDEDWIRCRRGGDTGDTGLVPVGYTSLIM
ncbi:AP-4 complex accessory subunit RUSC1 [Mantella aurantiaca]